MRFLYLLRHASAASAGPGQRDVDRPLTEAGREEASRVGSALHEIPADPPGTVLCSTAARALETLEQLRPHLRRDGSNAGVYIEPERGLYNAGRDELLEYIAEVDSGETAVMIIAHNPGIAVLANALAQQGESGLLEAIRRFEPASLAVLRLDIDDWSEVRGSPGQLVAFVPPGDRSAEPVAPQRDR